MLDLTNRPILLISGGFETIQKTEALLAAGADLTVMGEKDFPEVEAFFSKNKLKRIRREYQPGDLEPYFLVISHPADKSKNIPIAKEAAERKTFLVAVDDTPNCSAILPSVHRQGDLVFSISTSGIAPALGVRIKQKLQKEFGGEYAVYLEKLRQYRKSITASTLPFDGKKKLWYDVVDSPALELIRQEKFSEFETLTNSMLQNRTETCAACKIWKDKNDASIRPAELGVCCQEAF